MAEVPEPGGAAQRVAEDDAAKSVLILKVRDEERRFAPNNVPLGERLAVRRATGGIPLEQFWSGQLTVGLDSFAVLWWLAGRVAGDKRATLEDAFNLFEELTASEYSMDVEVEESDHPEV